jgi:hypothetical protein
MSGPPRAVLAALIVGEQLVPGVEISGDHEAFEALREMVVLPERLREGAEAVTAAATARTA